MPSILELREIDGQLWARILSFAPGETAVTLWTETEKEAALEAERERCVTAIRRLGLRRGFEDLMDEAVRDTGMSDEQPAD